MAPAKVQSNKVDNGFGGGTSCTCTAGASATTVGNYIVAMANIGQNTTIVFSDSAGNTWTTEVTRYWSNIGSTIGIGWAKVASSAVTTVTATYGTSGVFRAMVVAEVSGIAASSPLDVKTVGNNSSASTTPSDVSMTTTAADDMVISAISSDGATVSAGTGFTAFDVINSIGMEYQVKSAAGAITPVWAQSSAVQAVIVSMALKSDGGGAPALPPSLIMQTRRAY